MESEQRATHTILARNYQGKSRGGVCCGRSLIKPRVEHIFSPHTALRENGCLPENTVPQLVGPHYESYIRFSRCSRNHSNTGMSCSSSKYDATSNLFRGEIALLLVLRVTANRTLSTTACALPHHRGREQCHNEMGTTERACPRPIRSMVEER